MRFKFRIPLLLAMLAVGAFGVSAASASAHVFLAFKCSESTGSGTKYSSEANCYLGVAGSGVWERLYLNDTVEVLGTQTNDQGFEIIGAVSVCPNAMFTTNGAVATGLSSGTETLLIHPEYTNCKVTLAGATHNATVETTGCNYVFHAAAELSTTGTVDVECESGKEIKVKVSGLNCEIKVGPQTGLKTVEYMNTNTGKVEVKAEVSGITYTVKTCPAGVVGGNGGLYREGIINGAGEAELATAGHPATALAEGKNGVSIADQ